MLPKFKGIKYEEALKKLKLNTLQEERKNRADLISFCTRCGVLQLLF